MTLATFADPPPTALSAETLRSTYAVQAGQGDVMGAATGDIAAAWDVVLDELIKAGGLTQMQEQIQRRVDEMGTSFRLPDESEERQWPLSPVPLLIDEDEWSGIAAAVAQRAELAERLVADIYGQQRLVTSGVLPASVLTGSPQFLRPMVGIKPVGDHYLHVCAADLGRGPDGEWRVLADHTRSPAGSGYALENRLAASHVLGGISSRLNVARLAPFFTDLRAGIAASCHRSDPRIALLTPGRFNQSYAEQAHLARYLGVLLVEGADIAAQDDHVYLRTIEGMKRVDALWQRMDARLLDPLTLDPRSTIGVPGLVDAMAAGGAVVANFPGAAVLEAPMFAAFMPLLAQRLMGERLLLPNIATWWCGQPAEAQHVLANMDKMVIASAFGPVPVGLDHDGQLGSLLDSGRRARLKGDLARRPQDYIGQEVVRLSTMPVAEGGELVPRPFSVRVFAARDGQGRWSVMPGGFARIGPDADVRATSIGVGTRSADVIVHGQNAVAPVTMLRTDGGTEIRRNPGTLPSRVADNLFWLGRYIERGEAVLALVRVGAGGSLMSDSDPIIPAATAARIRTRLEEGDASRLPFTASFGQVLAAAMDDYETPSSVASLLASARNIGSGSRERLAPDFWQLLDTPFPQAGLFQQKNMVLKARFAAFAGLAAEHMGRTAGWRFHDLGRRIERAVGTCRLIAAFGDDNATAGDLMTLLELCDVQITYRQRYSTGLALLPVRDLVGLDPFNPRSVAFQINAIREHLTALPRLSDDGMDEPQQSAAVALAARISTLNAETLNGLVCRELAVQLLTLSDAINHRFFLRGRETLRASGLTLA
jgi:uncharacterized circularly permuted ATP-grasp superfamily protein/uncharacterized alpha-E superfamily protein